MLAGSQEDQPGPPAVPAQAWSSETEDPLQIKGNFQRLYQNSSTKEGENRFHISHKQPLTVAMRNVWVKQGLTMITVQTEPLLKINRRMCNMKHSHGLPHHEMFALMYCKMSFKKKITCPFPCDSSFFSLFKRKHLEETIPRGTCAKVLWTLVLAASGNCRLSALLAPDSFTLCLRFVVPLNRPRFTALQWSRWGGGEAHKSQDDCNTRRVISGEVYFLLADCQQQKATPGEQGWEPSSRTFKACGRLFTTKE